MSVRKVYQVVASGGFVVFSGSYKGAMDVYASLNKAMDHFGLDDLYPLVVSFVPNLKKEVNFDVQEDASSPY